MIKFARSVFVLSIFGFAVACSSGSSDSGGGGDSTGDSRSKETSRPTNGQKKSSAGECSADFGCLNGSCHCTGTKNKGKSCCDPDDSSCDGKSDNCGDTFCENCTGTGTEKPEKPSDDTSPPKDPPAGSCTDKGKECDLDSDCCSNQCDIVDGCQ